MTYIYDTFFAGKTKEQFVNHILKFPFRHRQGGSQTPLLFVTASSGSGRGSNHQFRKNSTKFPSGGIICGIM